MGNPNKTLPFKVGASVLAVLAALGLIQSFQSQVAAQRVEAPRFEVDPFWPKPLPNHWLLGSTIGVWVDTDDHVWIVHRPSSLAANERSFEVGNGDCCASAPPVLEFDQAGNLLRHWGGPGEGYEWHESLHGIYIDYKGNVWLGGNGASDSHILKFTKDGKFVAQFGKKGIRRTGGPAPGAPPNAPDTYTGNSNDTENFGRPAKFTVDPLTNEAYVADGYLNKRVAVLDADTGKVKRWWGANGAKPDDAPLAPYDPAAPPALQFRNPVHCAELSVDRLVYVCDRLGNRLQVFTTEGKFVKEAFFSRNTKGQGAVWDIAFSKDREQKFIFMADGTNEKIHIVDRQSLQELTTFGDGGRQPGQFYAVHSIAIDSKGNLYTTETFEGKRVQRFVNKGLAPVTKAEQGTPWPSSSR